MAVRPRPPSFLQENLPMSYLIAAYGITLGVLVVYGMSLARERKSSDSAARGPKGN